MRIEHFSDQQALHDFINLLVIESENDIHRIDEQFQTVIQQFKDKLDIVNQIYSSYFEMLLQLNYPFVNLHV